MLCITFSKFSVHILLPPFKAHTVQHLPLCLFNLLFMFDIWAEEYHSKTDLSPTKCFLSFQPVCEHCGFPAKWFDSFHLYDISLLWWWLSFRSKLNHFQILVAWAHFPGRVCVFTQISLHSKDSKDYNTSTVLVLILLILNLASMHLGEAKQGGQKISCVIAVTVSPPAVLPSPKRPAHSCSQ